MDITDFKRRVSSPRAAPFNTGKVCIGIAYVGRQRWEPSRDAYDIQTALLNRGPRPSLLQRFWRAMS